MTTISKTNVTTVSIESIVVDESFNVRQTYDEKTMKALAAGIRKDGMISPPLVEQRSDGKYFLIAGFRRFKVAKEILEWEELRVMIWDGDEVDAYYINVAENTQRDELRDWELAYRCHLIAEKFDESGGKIATRVGKSRSYINNLIRIVNDTNPKILEWWKGGNPLCTTDFMIKIASFKDHEEQMEKFLAEADPASLEAQTEEGAEEKETPEPKRAKRPSTAILKAALKATQGVDADLNKEVKLAYSRALKFAMGANKTITGIFDPDDEKE